MKKLIIKLIHIYQRMPINTHNCCRYTPTCSNYMIEAINVHGVIYGLYLGIKRILRCNPLFKGGVDLVPRKEK